MAPEAMRMIGAVGIRLTVSFPAVFVVRDPAAKCLTGMSRRKTAPTPAKPPALASDPSARPSGYKRFPSPPTAQPVNLPIQRFPLSPGKAHFLFPLAQSVSVTSV